MRPPNNPPPGHPGWASVTVVMKRGAEYDLTDQSYDRLSHQGGADGRLNGDHTLATGSLGSFTTSGRKDSAYGGHEASQLLVPFGLKGEALVDARRIQTQGRGQLRDCILVGRI